MARKGISKDQVFNAANAIKARGIEPTITLIRNELGEGSFSTISQHLATWKTQDQEVIEVSEIPPNVEEAVLQACATVWNICQKESSKEVKAAKQEAKDSISSIQNDLELATKENEELTQEVAKLEKLLEQSEKKSQQTANELTACQAKLNTTNDLYKELLNNIKQPEQTGKTTARKTTPKRSPESKQV